MLWETMERVNRLRKQAMTDPEFLKAAQEHAKTLEWVEQAFEPRRFRRNRTRKIKALSDIYEAVPMGDNPSGISH